MAQKKDLNISPYYDDFDPSNNFYKVLFKPGFPVQARELTSLQSILQNQVKEFGSHIFKEGSEVIPGGVTIDVSSHAVKLNATQFGVDISVYTDQLIGKVVEGETTGVTATVDLIAFPDGGDVEDITIYVKYQTAGIYDSTQIKFKDGESLLVKESLVYGNTTINAGTAVATLIAANATFIGSTASISNGVYFVRGTFVNVSKQTIILDHYLNYPSYRIGLKVDEIIISAKDDPSLYDNAKGFTNYAAPGADRLKISLSLSKKLLTDKNDTDFIEIARTDDGEIKKINNKTQYNIIRDYIAERTYEESGNYALQPFTVNVVNSLNDRLGNGGLYYSDQKTENDNTPSDDLMCVKISEGEAYVKGYDVTTNSTSILDVPKPRDTKTTTGSVPFNMGNNLIVNNLEGQPQYREVVDLYGELQQGTTHVGVIGQARVFSATPRAYQSNGQASSWNLRLYDVQMFDRIALNDSLTASEVTIGYHIKGKNSGAEGYSASNATNPVRLGISTNWINVDGTNGTYLKNEPITINGEEKQGNLIKEVIKFSPRDVKSIQQTAAGAYTQSFKADALLQQIPFPNGITQGDISGGNKLESPGKIFTNIKAGDILSYQKDSYDDVNYNVITGVGDGGRNLPLAAVSSVAGVYRGAVDNTARLPIFQAVSSLESNDVGLYGVLPERNISSVDFSSSTLTVSAQLTGQSLSGMGGTASISAVKDGSGVTIPTAFFEPYSISQYSVHFGSTAGFATVTADKFELLSGGASLSLAGLGTVGNADANTVISVTAEKQGIQSKVKEYQRSQLVTVDKSNFVGSGSSVANLNDGLTYNSTAYGLRVQDESISLNVADVSRVLAVYESLDTSAPTLDNIEFPSSANVLANAKIGENIIGKESGTIARVVTNNSSTPSSGGTNKLGIVYLNERIFNVNEQVSFNESNIQTIVENINSQPNDGQYINVTNSFYLDKGQREQYYDYSRIIRRKNTSVPSRQLLIVMDYYDVPIDDTGDVFSVLSYDGDRYTNDIPLIGDSGIRATDTLDFRPRVSPFNVTDSSPFSFERRTTGFGNTPKFMVTANENTVVKYDYYLGRIDKVYLDVGGQLQVIKGQPAKNPQPPMDSNDSMLVADIVLPPYLYNPRRAQITLADNRRYTMRDIGILEDRIESLETVTTLSLLEVGTEAMTIQDAYGRDRFKSGFFVDSFITDTFVDLEESSITVDTNNKVIRPLISRNSLSNLLLPSISTVDEELDFGTNYSLYDPNVQKTGNAVTLKYEEVSWVEQSFATEQENVNPFHVVSFSSGTITLSPESDSWSRTIQQDGGAEGAALLGRISDINASASAHHKQFASSINHLNLTKMEAGSFNDLLGDIQSSGFQFNINTDSSTHEVRSGGEIIFNEYTLRQRSITLRDGIIFNGEDGFMRSRNTSFYGTGLRPFQRHYQFLDGNGDVDVIPKLIEIASDEARLNYGSSTAFQVGETVKGYIDTNHSGSKEIFNARVATSNHKEGPFGNPTKIYSDNPYVANENIQAVYTSNSKVLNIDTIALAAEAQGLYSGYITNQTRLVGQSSGAVAYVKDIQLKPDGAGEVQGSFFLRDPHTTPPPSVTIETGTKTYKLTSSSSNAKPATGSDLISSAATRYRSVGTLTVEGTVIDIEDRDVTIRDYWDPLAQSFTVGANIEAPDSSGSMGDDDNGIFLTSVDLFFANKDSNNKAVTVEVRTMELGTPTRNRIGRGVTLLPNQITTSTDGSVATNVKFPEPIYLGPGQEYAIVLLAPTSMEFEVYVATMNQPTLASQNLPNASAVIYSEQWALGSLFKSQNGSIWEPSQLQDMKLKLYKAKFVNSGTAFFANPTLNSSNGFGARLGSNPILTLPKTGQIKIDTLTVGFSTFTGGTIINGATDDEVTATIVDTGCSASRVGVLTGGTGYQVASAVETFAVTGKGSGFRCNIAAVDANGTIEEFTGIVTTANGTGYRQGDIVGIVTAGASGSGTGTGALFSVTAKTDGIDTLFLTNIKGTAASGGFINNGAFRYTDGGGNIQEVVGTLYDGNLVEDGTPNDGKHIYISQFDHGMYATNNKLTVTDVRGSSKFTNLGVELTTTEASNISVGSTSGFETFEGLAVSPTNPGYVRINDEVIGYAGIGSGILEVASSGRGTDSTQIIPHNAGSYVEKYELNGVSLRRINKEHTISSHDIGFDDYYIEIDRTTNGVNRSSDSTGKPQLSFDNQAFLGGESVQITKNMQYDAVVPTYNLRTPSSATEATASIRTVSGTSIGGNEVSFLDQGFEPVQLNTENELSTPRIICSKVNENEYLNNIDRNKSFTTAIEFSTTDESVSPIINLRRAQTQFRSNRLNNPVSDYATNALVKTSLYDNHSAIYVSNIINLDKPADGLKVILSANRPASADFRVLYALIKKDSSSIDPRYTLFPGYDNLIDTDESGFGDQVIDPANNSGLPDTFVSASVSTEFLEYQFTANNLGEFTGYRIKIVMSGTNQAQEPKITDLRTIALK